MAGRRGGEVALGAVLGLASVAELAARLTAGSTVRAGLAAGAAAHTGVSVPTALLMCAFCLLATVPAPLLRPVPAAVTVSLHPELGSARRYVPESLPVALGSVPVPVTPVVGAS